MSITLEKSLECINITKLCAIFLLKTDFNAINKIVFNTCVMLFLESREAILYKIIGRYCSQFSIHIRLEKKLIANISNQFKHLAITISANTTNYCNRIIYPILSLLYHYFRLTLEYLLVLFSI